MTWTAQAELLADTIREPGFGATAVTASAWNAGVHPEATNGLVGAAVALIGNDALSSLWSPLPPCPDDATLLREVTELEGGAAELLRHCERLISDCEAAAGEAVRAWQAARASLGRAQALGNEAAATAAQDAMEAAGQVIADCDAALEILGRIRDRLAYALKCLRQVPDDFAQHYEVPYEHKRHYGPLPVTGDFLTAAA